MINMLVSRRLMKCPAFASRSAVVSMTVLTQNSVATVNVNAFANGFAPVATSVETQPVAQLPSIH